MHWFDMRTIILSFTISNFICMCVIGILWKRNRTRFQGLGFWLACYVMHLAAFILIALRGKIPDVFSMTLSNGLVFGGVILLLAGFENFFQKPGRQIQNYILLALFFVVHFYFVHFSPDQMARNLIVTVTSLFFFSQCVWMLFRRCPPEMAPYSRGVGLVLCAFCLASVCRLMVELFFPAGKDFFASNAYEGMVFLAYQLLYIVLTFSLSLMVNSRLFAELESDIRARREVEGSLRLSEEKFSKAFLASPNPVLISRLKDGRFCEVNESFCRLTGYTREELLASSSLEIRLWEHPEDREKVISELRTNRFIRNYESHIRKRDGSFLTVLCSAETMLIHDEIYIVLVLSDISERKRTDELLRLRLTLWEYALDHSALEVMEKALDEIEVLTDSRISFYHLVEEESSSLTLQAWSARTKQEFCKAEAGGKHYPIEEAGVWADCIRERQPVIHNDYASLPNRKGQPAGHAGLLRELVVPILRKDRIVSILGVGNKPADYTNQDVEMVSYIADLVWTIVEQKQANEKIRGLNIKLEYLSMTDELTGLPNRRHFFMLGVEEIKKARRYRQPLSLLMLDIDHFKNVNDTFGHDAGDGILRCFAETLRKNGRDSDLIARIGGEEFVILLPNTKPVDAMTFAERLRASIEREGCTFEKKCVPITASIGVASFNEATADLNHLIKEADNAMYRAKNEGRNRVMMLG